jgi:hypothetical protein
MAAKNKTKKRATAKKKAPKKTPKKAEAKAPQKDPEEGKKKRALNLRSPWPKGTSGNPKGRKKGQRSFKTIYKEALAKIANASELTPQEVEDIMIGSGIMKAMNGDIQFFKYLHDQIHGKAVETNDITMKGDNIKGFKVIVHHANRDKTKQK